MTCNKQDFWEIIMSEQKKLILIGHLIQSSFLGGLKWDHGDYSVIQGFQSLSIYGNIQKPHFKELDTKENWFEFSYTTQPSTCAHQTESNIFARPPFYVFPPGSFTAYSLRKKRNNGLFHCNALITGSYYRASICAVSFVPRKTRLGRQECG